MWLGVTVAAAEPAPEVTCPPLRLAGTLPREGDEGVPPGIAPVVVYDGGCGLPPHPSLWEWGWGGDGLPATPETIGDNAVRLAPSAPLAPGDYRLHTTATGDNVPFTVGEGAFATPSPPTLDGAFGGACGALATLTADVTASFPDAAADQRGLVVLFTSVDGLPGPPETAAAYAGQATVELSADVIGGRRLCVSLALDDLAGERVWETDEICGDEFVCEGSGELGPPGRGCATGGDAGAIGILAALVPLVRRRR